MLHVELMWHVVLVGCSIMRLSLISLLGLAYGSDDCLERQIRLWLHLDMTGSFHEWRHTNLGSLTITLRNLTETYPNLKFGVSGFGDRPSGPKANAGQSTINCYREATDFDAPFDQKKLDAVKYLGMIDYASYSDLAEDPLAGLAYIAKHKFGDYNDDEVRIITVLTDYGPHYGPRYKAGTGEPSQKLEDLVTCDKTKRWFTLNEVFDPVKIRRVYPLITLYPGRNGVKDWNEALTDVGYEPEHLVDMGPSFDAEKFKKAIVDVVDAQKCKPAPTNAPSEGTIQTISTTTQPSTTTQLSTPNTDPATTPTQAPPQSVPASESGNSSNKTPAIAGAAAGAAALIAAGLGYRFTRSSNPNLNVREDQAVGLNDSVNLDREAVADVDEAAFN